MKAAAFSLCILAVAASDPLASFLNLGSETATFAAVRDQELEAIEQDPCAGCSDPYVVQYQKCMVSMSNNPCTTQYTGVAFDNGCCITKEKHGRCLTCKSEGSRPHYNSKWTDQANSGMTVTEP